MLESFSERPQENSLIKVCAEKSLTNLQLAVDDKFSIKLPHHDSVSQITVRKALRETAKQKTSYENRQSLCFQGWTFPNSFSAFVSFIELYRFEYDSHTLSCSSESFELYFGKVKCFYLCIFSQIISLKVDEIPIGFVNLINRSSLT